MTKENSSFNFAGFISTGAFPLVSEILAPIEFSGSAILAIGLEFNDLSPLKEKLLPVPDRNPVKSLIPVPELPKNKSVLFFDELLSKTAFFVEIMSSPNTPLFIGKSRIAALCAIDLSSGNSIWPEKIFCWPNFYWCHRSLS